VRIECLAQELNVHNDPGLIQSPVWQSLGHHVFYRCSCTVIPHMQVPVFPSERLSHQNCFDSLPHSYFVGVPKFYGFHIHIQAALLIVFSFPVHTAPWHSCMQICTCLILRIKSSCLYLVLKFKQESANNMKLLHVHL